MTIANEKGKLRAIKNKRERWVVAQIHITLDSAGLSWLQDLVRISPLRVSSPRLKLLEFSAA
jgi:hypothetical protein